MMISTIKGTNWEINTELLIYEQPNFPGHFLYEENREYDFQNIEGLEKAIIDVKDIFEKTHKIRGIEKKELEIVYSRETPVTIQDKNRIGLRRVGNNYFQDAYQFGHELFHFFLNGRIPGQYKWFEECLCSLSSRIVLNELCRRNIKQSSVLSGEALLYCVQATLPQKRDGEDEEEYINIPRYYSEHLSTSCQMYNYDRDFEKTFSFYLLPILEAFEGNMAIFRTLPKEAGSNFAEYLEMWEHNLTGKFKCISKMLRGILNG